MTMKNKSFLMLAGLSALSLQAQAVLNPTPTAGTGFSLSNLSFSAMVGTTAGSLPMTDGYSIVSTPEPAAPDLVTSTAPVITVVTTAPTKTAAGNTKTTTTFVRTTTQYTANTAATETYKVVATSPAITELYQRVRLYGSVKSSLATTQTLTFSLIANGGYQKYLDLDDDPTVPGPPSLKYLFASSAVTSLVGSSNPNNPTYDSQNPVLKYHENNLAPLTVILGPHETKYFETQIVTSGNSSVSDYLISFTGVPSGGQAEKPLVTDVVEVFNQSIPMLVPEPETYAMLLAGLGAIGFVAHRKRRVES